MGQAVGVEVQIRLIYLVDVAREDYLGALAGPGDDGLDLVGSQVLGLVHDEEHVAEAASADIGQRIDEQLLRLEHVVDLRYFLAARAVAALDDGQVVEQRQHVRTAAGSCQCRPGLSGLSA